MRKLYIAGRQLLALSALLAGASALPVHGQVPTISSVLPTRNAYAAGANSLQSFTFSQTMSGAPGSTGSVRMFGSLVGGRKAGTGSAITNKLLFSPTVAANAGERISTTVTTAAQSSGGFNLATGQVTQFTAAAGGTGQGFYGQGAGLAIASTGAVIPDIDGDGDLDLLSVQPDGVVGVYRNTGTGGMVFHAFLTQGTGLTLVSPQTADVDGDGDMDLLIGDALNSQVLLWKNNGAGTFTFATPVATGVGQIKELRLGDFDADGDLDLAATYPYQAGQPLVRLFANNGTGAFTLLTAFANGSDTAVSLEVGDMNNDGDLDLALLASFPIPLAPPGSHVLTLSNNGSGTFTLGPVLNLPAGAGAVRLADFDHDGDLDAALGYTNQFLVYANNGTGTLGNTPVVATILVSSQVFDWQVADVNGDGWTDLLYTSYYGFLQTGMGCLLGGPGLTWSQQRLTTDGFNLAINVRLLPGDLDGDGDIDLLAYCGQRVFQLYNEPVMRLQALQPLPNAINVSSNPYPYIGLIAWGANQSLNTVAPPPIAAFSAQAGGRRAGSTYTGGVGVFTPAVAFRPGEVVSVSATTANISYPTNIVPPRGLVWQFTMAATGGLGFFSAAASLPTGAAPNGVVAADFNGDGTLDEATSNATGASVTVRLGTGGGAFAVPGTFALAGTTPRGLAAGDVDNDGDIDLAVTTGLNSPSVSVRFLINAGNATFALGAGLVIPGNPQEPALADVNADGNLDLLTANFFGSASIRIGNGAGAFSGSQSIVMATPCTSVAVGDVDNDGDLDLVAGSYGGGTVGIRLNDGLGTFSLTGADLTTLGEPRNVALADITADGILDLVVAGDGVERAIGLGGGAFAGFISLGGAGTQVNDVATGDIDGDSDLDVLASTTTPAQVKAYLNTGFGLSFAAGAVTPVSASVLNLTTADLDDDGDIDFLASSTGNSTVNVLLNQNTPPPLPTPPVLLSTAPTSHQPFVLPTTNLTFTFDQPMSNAPASANSARVFGGETGRRAGAGSVAGNAIIFNPTANFRPGELVSATMTTNAQAANNFPLNPLLQGHVHQFRAAAGVGPGVFNGGWSLAGTGPAAAPVAADIDGDGDADALVADYFNNLVTPYFNNGPGPFVAGTSVTTGTEPTTLAAADVDGDGDVDFVTANNTGVSISIRLNNGAGVFSGAQDVTTGALTRWITVGDIDGDGDIDCLAGANNAVFRTFNSGNGTFGAASTILGGPVNDVTLSDADGDGDLDLLVVFSSSLSTYLNNGTGNFSAGSTLNLGGLLNCLTVGDVDGDGDPDVALGDALGAPARICLNNGAGVFAVSSTIAAGFNQQDVNLADIDGDGDLDLLINSQGDPLRVRLNNGGGSFSGVLDIPTTLLRMAVADFDGDNDLDLLGTNSGGTVAVAFNEYADLIISTTMNVPPGPWHNITVTGTGNGTLTGPETVTGAVVVQTGGVWNDGCFTLGGPGTFTLQTGAILNVCHPQGISLTGATGAIQVAGARTYSATADYTYLNPSLAQITGNGFTGARNLTVNAPSGLSLTSNAGVGRLLTITSTSGNFALGGQALTLLSTAGQTAMVVVAGTGTVTGNTAIVQRYLTPALAPGVGYRHMTAPVSGSTVSDLAVAGVGGYAPYVNPAYNPLPTPVLPLNLFPNIFGFDETRGGPTDPNFVNGWFSPLTLGDPLVPGRGYSVYMNPLTPDFVGTLGTGPVPMTNLTRTGAFLGNTQKSGWHLLGNPYPAPISWDLVTPGQIPVGMSNSISVYQSTGGNNGLYLTRAAGIGSLPNGHVAMGQAFFARVTGTGPVTFTFTNGLRLTSYANPPHYRAAPATRPVLSLSLHAVGAPAEAVSEAFVYAEAGATPALDDRFDGPVPGRNVGNPTLVSLTPQADELAVNGLPETLLTQPTTVELLADLPQVGAYELTLGQRLNLDGVTIALLDRLTGTRYDLARQPGLTFTADQPGEIRERFALVFNPIRPTGLTTPDAASAPLTLWPNPARENVRISGLPTGTAVQLLDATGRVVRTSNEQPETRNVNLRGLPAGVYTVRANDGCTARLIIE